MASGVAPPGGGDAANGLGLNGESHQIGGRAAYSSELAASENLFADLLNQRGRVTLLR